MTRFYLTVMVWDHWSRPSQRMHLIDNILHQHDVTGLIFFKERMYRSRTLFWELSLSLTWINPYNIYTDCNDAHIHSHIYWDGNVRKLTIPFNKERSAPTVTTSHPDESGRVENLSPSEQLEHTNMTTQLRNLERHYPA